MVGDLIYGLDMTFFFVFDIDENVIQIYNDKNIKLFCKDLNNIALEGCQSISQLKEHYLILKITISTLESCFPLIFFANSYLIIGTYEIKLGKLSHLPQSI